MLQPHFAGLATKVTGLTLLDAGTQSQVAAGHGQFPRSMRWLVHSFDFAGCPQLRQDMASFPSQYGGSECLVTGNLRLAHGCYCVLLQGCDQHHAGCPTLAFSLQGWDHGHS